MNNRSMWLASAAMLAGAALGAGLTAAPIAAATAPFSPPASPMKLTRSVYRTLIDGKEIVVSRQYAIRFTADARGYRVDGELVDVQVSAPPSLAGLAEIERKRADQGLFPVRVGSDGMIVGAMVAPVVAETRQRGFEGGAAVLAGAHMKGAELRDAKGFLAQVTKASAGTAWPQFLFNPGRAVHREVRQVPLADGTTGEVEVQVKADGLMPSGLAHRVERTVITRIAGTERTAREVWTLTS